MFQLKCYINKCKLLIKYNNTIRSEEGRIIYSPNMKSFVNNNSFNWKPKQTKNIDIFFE